MSNLDKKWRQNWGLPILNINKACLGKVTYWVRMSRSHTPGHTSLQCNSNIFLISVSNALSAHQKTTTKTSPVLVPELTTVSPYCLQKTQEMKESFRGEVSGQESPGITALLTPTKPSTALDSNLLGLLPTVWPGTSYWTSLAKVTPSVKGGIINSPYLISLSWKFNINCPEGWEWNTDHRNPPGRIPSLSCCSVLLSFVLMQSEKPSPISTRKSETGGKCLHVFLWQIHTLEVSVCKSYISVSGSPGHEWGIRAMLLSQNKQTCHQSLSFPYHSVLGISLSVWLLSTFGRLIWSSPKSLLFCTPWMLM